MGNGAKTVGYTANGEASDWMLAERGIYALSPELGTQSLDSQKFFLDDFATIKDVASNNHPWMLYVTKQLQPWLHFNFTGIHENSQEKMLTFQIQNLGLTDLDQSSVKLVVNNSLFKEVRTTLGGKEISTHCAEDHCYHDVTGVAAQNHEQIQLHLIKSPGVEIGHQESITLEYWHNKALQ